MRAELKEAGHELRSAARATLLAVRSMIEARLRRIDAGQVAARTGTDEGASSQGGSAPHEIV